MFSNKRSRDGTIEKARPETLISCPRAGYVSGKTAKKQRWWRRKLHETLESTRSGLYHGSSCEGAGAIWEISVRKGHEMRVRKLMAVLALAVGPVLFGAASPVRAGDADGDGVDDAIDVCNQTPPGTAVDAEGRPLVDINLDCDTDLRDFALFQQGTTGLLPVVIDTVPVGNPGNTGENSGASEPGGYGPDRICGAVNYVYNIGKFEVTAGQYTQFLNAVADDDTYGLYNTSMFLEPWDCKTEVDCPTASPRIERTGSSGSYTYRVLSDWANRPVDYVSWGDAARFANWLHNGQPEGAQDLTTTEDGSYFLDGATSNAELMAVVREPDATWVIPSEDEWYKAAYHYNDGVTGNYFDYPTSSNTRPSNDLIDPDPGNNATVSDFDGGGQHSSIGRPYYRTEAGAHENSDSPYGTFDQGGNVWEWTEAVIEDFDGSFRGLRGGAFFGAAGPSDLDAVTRSSDGPTNEDLGKGFRVSEIP